MYLPRCYYTPGEYFFLLLCVCSFNARRFSRPGDMMAHHGSERERERKKGEGCLTVRAKCMLSELSRSAALSGSPHVIPFISGTIQALGASLLLCSPSLINSGFVHLLCCMFVSAAKERSMQAPDTHVYINPHK